MALWVSALSVVVCFVAYVIVSLRIGAGVQAACETAMASHQGDRVEALMLFVEDDRHTLAERNRAVWALGQLGDRRALPLVRKYYSGQPCDHENALCERELGKAIKLLEGGLNASALVWRH